MKLIRGDDLYRSFEGFTRASDRLRALAGGVCPTCRQRTRYQTWLGRRVFALLQWLEPVRGAETS